MNATYNKDRMSRAANNLSFECGDSVRFDCTN